MTRDLFDIIGEGRGPHHVNGDDPQFEKVTSHEFTMALHYRNSARRSVLVSETGEASTAVHLPESEITIIDTGKTTLATKANGQTETVKLVRVLVPEWLAKDRGLI